MNFNSRKEREDIEMNIFKEIIKNQKQGIPSGIVSICSANELVLEAAMENASENNTYVLIEATANQVNQFGGYTGMKPCDFRDFVYCLADKNKFDKSKIILGGDHLGPLTWVKENEAEAMAKAEVLIRDFVLAGFTKIHIDTSMKVASDPVNEKLSDETIARRGARLCKVAEEAYQQLQKENIDAKKPVYVIGSEVPIPGGAQEEEETVSVTKPDDFKTTVDVFKSEFEKLGLHEAWHNVVAVVVQPGVEFGDASVVEYDREKASDLISTLKDYENIVFEGHSTDYQTPEKLRQMVEDGVGILKVGPALTFALREALFSLSQIESEIVPASKRSYFIETLDEAMRENPENWIKHYHGSETEIKAKLKYSYSDRARYYLVVPDVKEAFNKLIYNLSRYEIGNNILSQYMPIQYNKVREGTLKKTPEALIKDRVKQCLSTYNYATE